MDGFYDRCILGHGDMVMALAFCHNPQLEGEIPDDTWETHWDPGWSDTLKKDARAWQRKASHVVAGDVGFCNGEIYHLFHGCKKNRNYDHRGKALTNFDPAIHLHLDKTTHMWAWTRQAHEDGLVQACLKYFKNRKEDDTRVV
jgi:hypothetical protein